MSQGQMNSFGGETVGLKFTSPDITLTSQNMGINGGLSFDLPLAAITMSQNRALDFVSSNSQGIGQYLSRATIFGANSLDMTITGAGAQVKGASDTAIKNYFDANKFALTGIFDANRFAIQSAENVYREGSDTSRYITRRNTKRSVGCFITTAICESRGLPDDCEELTILRKWRDEVLAKMENGDKMIAYYYDVAPPALETIKKYHPTPAVYFDNLRHQFLNHALELIKNNHDKAAVSVYLRMVEAVQNTADYLTTQNARAPLCEVSNV